MTKQEVLKFVDEFFSDYYPEQQEGEYVGDAERLAEDTNTDLAIIEQMIADGELIVDSRQWVNPENDQHTIDLDIITTPTFLRGVSDCVYIRDQPDGRSHPDSFIAYDNFEDWRDEEVNNLKLMTQYNRAEEVQSWQSWDDLPTTIYQIMR